MDERCVTRTARADDAPRLAELGRELGYPVEADVLAGRLREIAGRGDDVVLAAVGGSGEVVGWLHPWVRSSLVAERHCEIAGMVVDARLREFGIGRRLVGAAEAWARGRGVSEMVVRSNVLREESHPFYERLGYVRVKTQHAYRKPLGGGRPGADGGAP